MQLPRLIVVRQKFPDRRIPDIPAEVRRQLESADLASKVKPGARIAIGVGSRGVRNIAVIAHSTVQYWKQKGMQPFLFPAMGSHGSASAAGQAAVLANYGITEATMGCPVVSQLDVVSLGQTPDGVEVFMDRKAWEADGAMLIGRVKWHTDFNGEIESGLLKMMAIGIGKLAGAKRYHTHAYELGLERVITGAARQVLSTGKMLGGLAVLEDAYHNTARLDAVPAEQMEQRERENLALVKSWMGRIPTDLDVLIVDEMGKNISGTGMDTKVVNRGIRGEYNPWPGIPKVRRLFVRDMSPISHGNAVGIGMADLTTDRLAAAIDWVPTRINSLTASNPAGAQLPIHFPTDRECLEHVASIAGRVDLSQVTYGWILNTLELDRIALSENLRGTIEGNPLIEIENTIDFDFDEAGNLVSPFAPVHETVGTH